MNFSQGQALGTVSSPASRLCWRGLHESGAAAVRAQIWGGGQGDIANRTCSCWFEGLGRACAMLHSRTVAFTGSGGDLDDHFPPDHLGFTGQARGDGKTPVSRHAQFGDKAVATGNAGGDRGYPAAHAAHAIG